MASVLCSLIIIIFCRFTSVQSVPAEDLINYLPGLNFQPPFKQYSGYLTANNKHFLHYWFVYSQANPSSDPVVLWLNGGPACSSLFGLLEELGPFRIGNSGNIVYENVYSWNKVANVIFLESPVGVGFSYSTDGNNTATDDSTAMDNYHALIDFFTNKFPEFHSNDFYITGESYAGFYLPLLGKLILQDAHNFPKFKGMAIGNGLLSYSLLVDTIYPMLYFHGIISETSWNWLGSNCCKNGDPNNCSYYRWFENNSSLCFAKISGILSHMLENMDTYNLYATCYLPSNVLLNETYQRGAFYKRFFEKFSIEFKEIMKSGKAIFNEKLAKNLPVCAQINNSAIYLNKPDVRTALHIPNSVNKWIGCNHQLRYVIQYGDMVSQIQEILNVGVKILVYNGDTDTLVKPKTFWAYDNVIPDTAGFVTRYQGIDFVTIRGSGHFVPMDKPRESLQMIANFLWNRPYSTPTGINIKPSPLIGGYCNQSVLSASYFAGPVAARKLCGNGNCINAPNGAHCSCAQGYSGKFCNNQYDVPSKTVQIQLCAAYPTPQTEAAGLNFGCPTKYTCVPYQYRCVTTLNCNFPIGYCLPWAHLFPNMVRKMKILKRKTKYIRISSEKF